MKQIIYSLTKFIVSFINSPKKVFTACLFLIAFQVFIQGGIFRLKELHQDEKKLSERIEFLKEKSLNLDAKIKKLSHPKALERLIQERLNLISHDKDLIFIFEEGLEASSKKETRSQ